ncbi:MAG: PAS domain-containing protein [Roseateles sp.]|nr:MAG: PAS domain-containing protein [Roseateles sp.]
MPKSQDPDLSALSPLANELATTIARVASDIALVIDRDGVISSVAEGAAVQAQGCSQWVGRRWIDTVSSGTRPKIQSLLDEVSRSGVVSRRREVSHPGLGGGEELPVTWSAIRLGANGPVLAVGRDLRAVAAIQQRFVEAQQDMERHYWSRRQSENRYQLLFQVAHDAVLVLEAGSLVVLQANAMTAELLGREPAELLGQALTDALPPGVRAAVLELLVTARGSGRAGEMRVRGPGLPAALDIAATPFTADGRRLLMLRARRDNGRVDDGLALSRMAEAVETQPDAVVITDSAGGVLMANPAFLRLLGVADEAALRGRALPELMNDAAGAWAGLLAQVSSQGLVASQALQIAAPDGGWQRVRASASLMAEGEQTCLGLVLRPDHRLPAHLAGDDVLAGLLDQVGRVPLADLLGEVAHRAERQLIASALLRVGGQQELAAQALGMSPEALAQRMQQHGLDGLVLGGTPPAGF